jgi:hypothetical protein
VCSHQTALASLLFAPVGASPAAFLAVFRFAGRFLAVFRFAVFATALFALRRFAVFLAVFLAASFLTVRRFAGGISLVLLGLPAILNDATSWWVDFALTSTREDGAHALEPRLGAPRWGPNDSAV